jgi:hypothetical protein
VPGGRLLCSLLMGLCALSAWGEEPQVAPPPPRPLVGAIRWDAWHGDREAPGRAMQRSLGPARYHWRLPFFAIVKGEDEVVIDGTAQEVMDQEIDFASAAGLDYWAFVTYNEESAMSLGLQRYLSSAKRRQIRFCLLTEALKLSDAACVERAARLMHEPGYLTVLGNRPLLYLGFIDETEVGKRWGSAAGFRAVIDGFRANLRASGLGDPYLVILDFDPGQAQRWAGQLGGDAVSSYVTFGPPEAAVPYARLAQSDVAFWEACRTLGASVVPIVTTGWDRRPRVEHPVPWETWQEPGVGLDRYVEAATPQELADHLKTALDWMAQHPEATPAQASLIYAWNENDEGGWIVPTLQDGAARLNAIGAMLRAYRRP